MKIPRELRREGLTPEAMNDLANLDKYLLPEDQRRAIAEAIASIENYVIDNPVCKTGLDNPVFRENWQRIYNTIMGTPRVSNPLLLAWSIAKQEGIVRHARFCGELKMFYEKNPVFNCGLLTPIVPKKKRIALIERQTDFFKDEERLHVSEVDFRNLQYKVEDVGEKPITELETATLTSELVMPWTGDYKTLGKRVSREVGERNIVLMNSIAGMPEDYSIFCALSCYFEGLKTQGGQDG